MVISPLSDTTYRAHERCYDYALYESTIYLLTYLQQTQEVVVTQSANRNVTHTHTHFILPIKCKLHGNLYEM